MLTQPQPPITHTPQTSPLVLSDHLITLAQEADRAGYTSTARRLVTLACRVFDEPAQPAH
jgi:hypothetical protein